MQQSKIPKLKSSLLVLFVALAGLYVLLGGCKTQKETQEARPRNEAQPKRYKLKGKVVSIDKPNKKLVIDHEAIPDFMDAMTMAYAVKDGRLLDNLAPGNQITADVMVGGGSVWLENIVVMKQEKQ